MTPDNQNSVQSELGEQELAPAGEWTMIVLCSLVPLVALAYPSGDHSVEKVWSVAIFEAIAVVSGFRLWRKSQYFSTFGLAASIFHGGLVTLILTAGTLQVLAG